MAKTKRNEYAKDFRKTVNGKILFFISIFAGILVLLALMTYIYDFVTLIAKIERDETIIEGGQRLANFALPYMLMYVFANHAYADGKNYSEK